MSHPAVRPAAVARIQSRLGAAGPAVTSRPASLATGPATVLTGRLPTTFWQAARRALAPVLDRLAARVAEAGRQDVTALRAELDRQALELERVRADLEAEVAMLRAELASRPAQ